MLDIDVHEMFKFQGIYLCFYAVGGNEHCWTPVGGSKDMNVLTPCPSNDFIRNQMGEFNSLK